MMRGPFSHRDTKIGDEQIRTQIANILVEELPCVPWTLIRASGEA